MTRRRGRGQDGSYARLAVDRVVRALCPVRRARRRTDKRVGITGAIIAGETIVFARNRFRCLLTELAVPYGAESGSVTDIYLPKWFAHNMPASIHRCSS